MLLRRMLFLDQSALFNFHSFLTVVLLVISTCTYIRCSSLPSSSRGPGLGPLSM
ncbi:unnamed protein product [Musa acuminata subsp. malaccensis]|uniref:(wild Malaysian banana) hypothetical protein n=1 Tax=Musa acuminata subsp. malaccensis TaxID=214687 RepID=A0A804I7W3_MUSAM|nr:unnamed protein product [Musa acuminata subsp. malaccensis]